MNAKFLKNKKYVVIALFLLAALLSVWLTGKVIINYNISDYLDDSTETKISLNIIEDEFGMTGNVQVMIRDIDAETAKDVVSTIKGIENVLTVNFDKNDENYYKDGNALFIVLVDGDEYSDKANAVVADIKTALEDRFESKINYGGSVVEKRTMRETIQNEIVFILAISVCLTIAIMLVMSKSWIEPLVLLMASGIAILINMGTNVIFGEISYITNAVAAILQLALSIDYSIVLLHGYRSAKTDRISSEKAMRRAIKSVIKPVLASALTTIAGLLALLFMTMKIGFDIGIVLMKSIVISALTSLVLLPALLLIFEKMMNKTAKRELVLKGKKLSSFAADKARRIVPIALALIILCGALQLANSYSFTDSKGSDTTIRDAFGSNNSVVVVYPRSDGDLIKEGVLADRLASFTTEDGKNVLKNYTAYSNTVKQLYDIDLAAIKLDISKSDVEMLFTMYHLYQDRSAVKLTSLEFVEYAEYLTENDADVKSFSQEGMQKTLRTLLAIDQIMNGKYTAKEFHELATTDLMDASALSLFAVKQMYGLYFYDTVTKPKVKFETMLNYTIKSSKNENIADMFSTETVADLNRLSDGVKQFNSLMETPLTPDEFHALMESRGKTMDRFTVGLLYAAYAKELSGVPAPDAVAPLDIMAFLASRNSISFGGTTLELPPETVDSTKTYVALYDSIHGSYTYDQFLPALSQIASELSELASEPSGSEIPSITTPNEAIQQLYVMYFYEWNLLTNKKIEGRQFIEFVSETYESNPIVAAQLSESGRVRLDDMFLSDAFLSDKATYDYEEITKKIGDLQSGIKSLSPGASLSSDVISGIYIKYAINNEMNLNGPIVACDLLDFIRANMDENEILKKKITEDKRGMVDAAKVAMEDATALLIGPTYSRMLLSIDLPSESKESTRFVEYLTASVKEVFGNDAHVAGEMISTYDLQNTFDSDNTLISIFTIVSIFLIVMIVFRSISLPVVLVAVIQGAIWISMSTSLLTGPMFFMSYIIASCILMGATIDYGILMSTTYVQHRQKLNKDESLVRAVEAALPTVFTSGLILTICGFVVGFISSQTSISTVGVLLGKGTLVSVLMITLVLPAVLYFLDEFILKLTLKSKKTKKSKR